MYMYIYIHICTYTYTWRFPEMRVLYPQLIHYNKMFQSKPSIFGSQKRFTMSRRIFITMNHGCFADSFPVVPLTPR